MSSQIDFLVPGIVLLLGVCGCVLVKVIVMYANQRRRVGGILNVGAISPAALKNQRFPDEDIAGEVDYWLADLESYVNDQHRVVYMPSAKNSHTFKNVEVKIQSI